MKSDTKVGENSLLIQVIKADKILISDHQWKLQDDGELGERWVSGL